MSRSERNLNVSSDQSSESMHNKLSKLELNQSFIHVGFLIFSESNSHQIVPNETFPQLFSTQVNFDGQVRTKSIEKHGVL